MHSAEWQPIAVPGSWEEKGAAAVKNYDGAAWYRTWVKVDDTFFTKHERNLYEESVSINIRDLADAHEIYVNGVSVGTGGQFPPDFKSGRGDVHRHKVPVGTLHQSEWNEIALRVYNQSGPGGFLGEAPFIMNYTKECVMAGPWEFSLGDDYRPGGALVEKPTTTAFDNFRASNRILGRSAQMVTGAKLPPQDSYAKMKSAPEFKVDLLLSEPRVAQPTHLSFDDRGRLWVSQYRQYPYPTGVNMVSRDNYYRSYYDRVPPPPPNHDRGADVISIHEDTDGDGIFDRHKMFQDGLNMANAAVRGRGGVWVMQTPYLLFYPDKDADDVPDGPPVVHLQGFGLEDSHAVANGLVWGPDGWLYGGVGSSTTSRVTRPGMDPPDTESAYFPGSMVWRYHPVTREFDVFAEGTGNLFGLEIDAQGRLYSGHNGGNTRGWHYVQGGFYLMQGVVPGRFGPPRNPYAFGDLPMMNTLTPVRRFSIFGAFAEGTAMPANRQGHLFTVAPLHNEMIESERLPRGSTFETKDVGRPLWSEDPAFRPVFAVNAPDGSLYVADFYEFYIAHGQHYQSQIDPSTGRIYRLRGVARSLNHDTNLVKKTTDQLVALLSHPNKWHRATAAFVLGERKDQTAVAKLQRLLVENQDLGALAALWALQQMDMLDDATIRS
ncbi:MAG: dehydrogenase, partial [Verrucomicrobia bacterium]|nr:dehydrogenase [Verrucomicrobiota bacterium]